MKIWSSPLNKGGGGGAVTVELDSFTTILFIVNMYESALNLSKLTPTCCGSQARDLAGLCDTPRWSIELKHTCYIDGLLNKKRMG